MQHVRQALVPGLFFGLNLAVFFAGATHNSVANAALIGSLSPFFIVPLGAALFLEYHDPRALVFALVAFGGLALVLFSAPSERGRVAPGQRVRPARDAAPGRLRGVDASVPPRHGCRHVHGDDLPHRGVGRAAARDRQRRRVRIERQGMDLHAGLDRRFRGSPPTG